MRRVDGQGARGRIYFAEEAMTDDGRRGFSEGYLLSELLKCPVSMMTYPTARQFI